MASAREEFGSRIGFILAAAGSAVGIGNLVGFPVNAAKNGGAAFLLIYALFVVFICLPVMLAEMAAGRHTRKNPLGAYRQIDSESRGSNIWAIGGWLALITPYMIAVFYAVITLWILGYFVASVSGDLQLLAQPDYFGQFINSDSVFIYLALISAITGLILVCGVKQGIERLAKTLMPTLFVMLVGLVIFGLTRDNAMLGVEFYLIPDFSKITPQVISGAMSQAFFSLSLGMGILITYGSYIRQQDDIPSAAKMVALTDTAVAFTAGLLILPAIFSFNPEVNPDELSNSSVSLIFSFLPQIFLDMQTSIGYLGASLVASLFFLLVLFAALTSLVSIIEVPLAGTMDQLKLKRGRALLILGATMVIAALVSSLSFGRVEFLTQLTEYGGQTKSLFDVIVDLFYDTILPLNGLFICAFVSYRWKKQSFFRELEQGADNYRGSLLERYVALSLGSFIPLILLLIFIDTVLQKFVGTSLLSLVG